jgi:2-haloacid dehalogenase
MKFTLAFDLFDTILDTSSIKEQLRDIVGDHAERFLSLWKIKQREYLTRKALMNIPADFEECSKQALDFCCIAFDVYLSGREKKILLKKSYALPAFSDVKKTLKQAKSEGHRIYAFSDGSQSLITELLQHADLFSKFDGIVGAQETNSVKPSPIVYEHFINSTNSDKTSTWLISGNSYDVIGAASYGLKTIWLQRTSANVYDPLGIETTGVIGSLHSLLDELNGIDN